MRFYFESYGCTMNHGEARIMQDILKEKGHSIVHDMQNSDAQVLVTCTVIETTERKMIKRIKTMSKIGKPVIVAGCMASVQKDQIFTLNPNAVILVPNALRDIGTIVDALPKDPEEPAKSSDPGPSMRGCADSIVPISSGCLGNCTYCITKLARGELRSNSPEMIIEDIRKALAEGYKEIRLTSQDTATYGLDIGYNLPLLLNKIQALSPDFILRVGMMNPEHVIPILQGTVNAYKDQKIYKFLHLPIQSGSERILGLMKRKYSITDVEWVLNRFREAFPEITISTDIIVGFPGESETDFIHSVNLIEKLRPDILNVTRFSPRPKTEALDMEGQIPSRIAKERSRKLVKIHAGVSHDINRNFVGSKKRILITKYGKNRTMMGRTDAYKIVVVEDEVGLCEFVDVKITDATNIYLKGKVM